MTGSPLLPPLAIPPTVQVIEFRHQADAGVPYYRERTPDSEDDSAVYACAVRRIKPGTYRAVVLYCVPQSEGCYLYAVESSREVVTRWLSERGLPTVRLHP